MVEVKLTLIVVRAALLHALFDREPIVTYAFEGSQDILTFSLTTHLLAKNYDRCNGMRLTSGSIVHSSRSRQDEASGPIIKPPEQTQEKLPGLLRHSPPLHGFSRLMRIKQFNFFCKLFEIMGFYLKHSSMSMQVLPSRSSIYPVLQLQENDPGELMQSVSQPPLPFLHSSTSSQDEPPSACW